MKNSHRNTQSGFTLLEILLVVAAIGILAGIVVFAINPAKQLGDTRNAQRKVDVNTILNAVYQYSIDNFSSGVPESITEDDGEICQTGVSSCVGFVDLSVLTDEEKYLTALPIDPLVSSDTEGVNSDSNGTGYYIKLTPNGRVTVWANYAEGGVEITVTR